jgi:hypothetical protein
MNAKTLQADMTRGVGRRVLGVACWLAGVAAAGVLCMGMFGVAPAAATVQCASCSAWWHVDVNSFPRDLAPGEEGEISVVAEDLGDGSPSGAVVLRTKLPAGLSAQSVRLAIRGVSQAPNAFLGAFLCSVSAGEVVCTLPDASELPPGFATPYTFLAAYIKVKVSATGESGEEVRASVASAAAATASASRAIVVSGSPTEFGIENYELKPENADGTPDTQAGSHPFQLTSVLGFDQSANAGAPPAAPKDLRFDLPPGLIGNPTPFPQCTTTQFLTLNSNEENLCPNSTVVGVASVTIVLGHTDPAVVTATVPLFSMVPSVGEPARFAFLAGGVPVYLDTSVRAGGDYGVTVDVDNITEFANFVGSRVTFWGVPGDPRHDPARGWGCVTPHEFEAELSHCVALGEKVTPPLLTLPTACTGPLHTTLEADSWEDQGAFTAPFDYTFRDGLGRPMGMDGCDQEPFTPSIKVTPDGQAGSTPTGLTVDEHVPQETDLNPTGLGESAVKGLSVALPAGIALNPAGADGLQACTMEGIGLQSQQAPSCPEASKVATVKIKTPLLPNPLEGAAYLATQSANPFGSLVAMYLYAEDPVSGVRAKAAGEVVEDPVSGQLTAHFEGDPVFAGDPRFAGEAAAQFLPEVPFEDVEVHFFGGDRAPLVTPARCGSYTTIGTFTPWSENATSESSSTFNITSGPNGSPCRDPLPFSPSLTAGTTSLQAGGFSPFVMTMSREDGEQSLQGIQLKMPPGVSGMLSHVKLCGEANANAGTCGSESEIGETIVSVGVGGDPYTVTGGKVYITGPYKGAPFGLSIVNPAKAGPFDLGKVVVRAKLEVNQQTAAITVTTDNEGPYKIPTMIDGIPLEIRHVNVNINRPGFTFNATDCNPLKVTGGILSTEGASSDLSVPYQVTNCAVLAFKPKFQASTTGKWTRADGTSLNVKLSYPAGPYDANISKVKVELPKVLPSRLSTLQKACLASVFEANPAGCPAASVIGHARATTPVLPVPLEGPAYFVSHGGQEWPSLIIVLQGYGVTVHLVGTTLISKTGVTSSTFKTVPDVPVGTFELNLPAGPYSALTGLGNLCKQKLVMPTEFVGQNGAEIHTNTKIAATGCAKAKTAKHNKKKTRHGKKHKKNAKHKK